MIINIDKHCHDFDSYRAARVKSLFNCDNAASFSLQANLPIENTDWRIGVIVGPSGSGKTSIGEKVFHNKKIWSKRWPKDKAIIDSIAGESVSFDDITTALTSVGLGSVPAWLRPYSVLSNGEKFRADMARILLENSTKVVVDEYTSVVDRQVAKIGSEAFSKQWRRKKSGQIIFLTPHHDIIEWVRPDWIYDTGKHRFSRGSLRRQKLEFIIRETSQHWWPYFEAHHYLKAPPLIAGTYYLALHNDEPIAHIGMSPRPGLNEIRAARFVVLPEWQGIGIGGKFLQEIVDMWRRGDNPYNKPMPTLINTSHPGLIRSLRRHPHWYQTSCKLYGDNKNRCSKSIMNSQIRKGQRVTGAGYGGHFRAIQGFRYLGE